MNEQRILDVDVERILPGGLGLAHAEGLTIFVSLAAPGDRVRVEINRVKGQVAFATIREILKPSSVRIEPPCPYFGRCGGCDFQQLTYEAQLNAKVEIIADCLHRVAKLPSVPTITIEPSPEAWKYRARTGWQVDAEHSRLGYFEGGSRRVCDVEVCAVLVPELQQALETLRTALRNGAFRDLSGEIDAVAGDKGVSVVPAVGGFENIEISRKVVDETYWFNAASFFQTNHQLLESLITEAIGRTTGDLALDLYCGVGLFTVPLGRRFKRVIGVESDATAVRFGRRNLQHAGLTNVSIVGSRVGTWLEHNLELAGEVDLLLLDPPRTGAEAASIRSILEIRPKELCYVSCDPATLARDLRKFLNGGYRIDSVRAFDMFPQTHHVETVVRLTLSK